ncbi:putative DNA-binding protein (MmcQ/YjbR family) [Knoellia remsis]|uniref:Putative DNA-binding protein (MmcQ/YjbR family) n=1 Tax=Knoellia remsis TaxID=407159 RepID=A0A2T0UUH0_9MICO|nr:MmcQ/YjbR family DNA-binding protein [Knoellia remsis]PRY61544.1 putative DNA-binding protein (MmcQ/YjbR family) [Knoellia remsis]
MTPDDLAAHALGKPGAWADQPWEGDHVAKVGEKIFAFLGRDGVGVKLGSRAEADEWLEEFPDDATVMPYIGRHGWNTLSLTGAIPDDVLFEAVDTSYELVVAKLPRAQRPDGAS